MNYKYVLTAVATIIGMVFLELQYIVMRLIGLYGRIVAWLVCGVFASVFGIVFAVQYPTAAAGIAAGQFVPGAMEKVVGYGMGIAIACFLLNVITEYIVIAVTPEDGDWPHDELGAWLESKLDRLFPTREKPLS